MRDVKDSLSPGPSLAPVAPHTAATCPPVLLLPREGHTVILASGELMCNIVATTLYSCIQLYKFKLIKLKSKNSFL